ncbi:type II secretion system protein GspK [Sphingobium sp. H39-3-25]|uniref:general secretion pathway protein GspK n=1 Tax=Sphingobium TaxID=165695 RepID=UPI0023B8D174|nr:type II secretion system protein GspK [Sphingobium arseniciresistens]
MKQGEEGYALVAAVASIAVFAAMALTILSATRMGIDDVAAEHDQLQAGAAADAGVARTLSNLLATDTTQRWPIDGREQRFSFRDARIRVKIEDERGKVPIGQLDEAMATRLLEEVGLQGDRLLIARDSLLDWTDGDEEVRPFGAESAYYERAGIRPANGFLASIEELGSIRGFDTQLVERIRPIATAYTARAAFDTKFADPRALAVMEKGGQVGSPVAIDRARERDGQRTALAFSDATDVVGRPLTIIVEAKLPNGARAVRRVVVEITGRKDRPYLVRASN